MTIHTRLHVDDPSLIVDDGTCLICANADDPTTRYGEQAGRPLDLHELLEQARGEVRARLLQLLEAYNPYLGGTPSDFVQALYEVAGR